MHAISTRDLPKYYVAIRGIEAADLNVRRGEISPGSVAGIQC